MTNHICHDCYGTGYKWWDKTHPETDPCSTCEGTGILPPKEEYSIEYQSINHKLDDPRHGQADAINRGRF